MRGTSGVLIGVAEGVCLRPDPYFPAWPDVLQLNAFQPGAAAGGDPRTISDIAAQCDGSAATWPCFSQSDLRTHLGRSRGTAAGNGILRDVIASIRKKGLRIFIHRRGLLGPSMGTATAGF